MKTITLGDILMHRILKTPSFNRWMKKSGLSNQALHKAVDEMIKGLLDADLGKGILKKRIPLPGHGKRGGARTLLATNKKDRWVFLFGFQKNEQENITWEELEGLQGLASNYLTLLDKELDFAVSERKLLEVCHENEK